MNKRSVAFLYQDYSGNSIKESISGNDNFGIKSILFKRCSTRDFVSVSELRGAFLESEVKV